MSPTEHVYRKSGQRWIRVSVGSLIIIGVFSYLLSTLSNDYWGDDANTLVVYCAQGIMPPVEDAAEDYEREYGVRIRLEGGSSGMLEGKLRLTDDADLYIPADVSFVERARAASLLAESMPVARFRLVLATKRGNPKKIQTLRDLLRPDVRYVLCDQKAGAGKVTKKVLEAAGIWKEIHDGLKAEQPTVTNAADSIRDSEVVDAGIVWDSTAEQRGLEYTIPPELEPGVSTIVAAVTTATDTPASALRFARYLAAPQKGQEHFEQHKYERIDGDAWAQTPRIRFFAGGVNRKAVEETLKWFERREGCVVVVKYGGCGSLIQSIMTGPSGQPDTFLTCDKSYMDRVEQVFGTASDVSTTNMVILVRAGNPKNILKLDDLARENVELAITDPEKSTLGYLSVEIMKDIQIYEQVLAKKYKTAPNAHHLFAMMSGNDQKLDAVIVYEANCVQMGKDLEIVPIRNPRAHAVQNIAVARKTEYPYLAGRLMQAILSRDSRERFLKNGFSWVADKSQP